MRRLAWIAAALLLGCGRSPPAPGKTAGSVPSNGSLTEGEAQYWRDQFDSARVIFRTALAEAEAHADSANQARALTWLSRAAYRLGDYEAARRDGERGIDLKVRLGLAKELFESWNTLGLLAWNQGRLVEAESLLTEASRAAAATGDQLGVGKAAANRGLVLVELGDYVGARAGFEAMHAAGQVFQDARVAGNALANLAMLDIREGDPRSSIPRLIEARRLYGRANYSTGEANALGQLATAWRDMGDYQAALAASDSALQLARRLGLRQEEAAELEVIATLHRETGDFAAALRRLEQAQRINAALDLKVEMGTDQRREAEIRLDLGQRTAAVEGGAAALEIHTRVGAQPERLSDLLFLAGADSARAGEWLRQARGLADSLRQRRARADVDLTEAELALASRDWPRAVRAVRAAAVGRQAIEPIVRWQIAETETRAYQGVGDLVAAEAAARRAVDAVERVRGSLGASWSRARLLASRAGSYAALTEILLAQERVEEAFTVADAARGRALLEHLAGIDTTETRSSSVLAALAARERTLRRIDDLERQLAAMDDDATPEAAETRIRRRRQLTELQSEYVDAAAVDPSGVRSATLLGGAQVDVAQVRGALAPDEAVVEYLIGREQVHAFVITSAGIHHVVLPTAPEELVGRVRIARDVVGRPGPFQAALPVLEALYTQLIRPISAAGWLDGIHRVVVVPQGVLGYLPFAALRDGLRGRYLVEDLGVMTVPSAASLVALRRLAEDQSSAQGGVVALAPFPEDLPGTSAELAGIARAVKETQELRGSRATEIAVRGLVGGGRVLHLATHGVLNPDNPLFSRIELRPSAGGTTVGDGRLEVHEVLGLSVGSPLVYLSGCETALGPMGPFTRGDELVTLAQSFLFAGARGVVATLWRVPDVGSIPLVEAFYRHLRRRSPADALAQAQRDLIKTPARASPYYWAGYVLSGDGGPGVALPASAPLKPLK